MRQDTPPQVPRCVCKAHCWVPVTTPWACMHVMQDVQTPTVQRAGAGAAKPQAGLGGALSCQCIEPKFRRSHPPPACANLEHHSAGHTQPRARHQDRAEPSHLPAALQLRFLPALPAVLTCRGRCAHRVVAALCCQHRLPGVPLLGTPHRVHLLVLGVFWDLVLRLHAHITLASTPAAHACGTRLSFRAHACRTPHSLRARSCHHDVECDLQLPAVTDRVAFTLPCRCLPDAFAFPSLCLGAA
jgi:hypothetical protein